MFRTPSGRAARLAFAKANLRNSRRYNTYHPHFQAIPPVRFLGPAIWSLVTVGSIYFGFAAADVYQEARKLKQRRGPGSQVSEDDVVVVKSNSWANENGHGSYRSISINATSPLALWRSLPGPEKVVAGAAIANTSVYFMNMLAPQTRYLFLHTPVDPRNYTLLTSIFGHSGLFHLGVNTLVTFNFAPTVGRTPSFEGNGGHLAAFYLSSGIMSSLGSQFMSAWPTNIRFIPSLGASGVVTALVSAWATSEPKSRLYFMFIPRPIAAEDFLTGLAAFETLGILGAWKWLLPNVEHRAHLTGLAIGWAYVRYNGKERLWAPMRRRAFKVMRLIGMV